MQTIELNPEEAEVLREVLQQNLAEIEVEIFRTDTHDFEEKLKHRRGSMEHMWRSCPAPQWQCDLANRAWIQHKAASRS